jgi:hypothetical protein
MVSRCKAALSRHKIAVNQPLPDLISHLFKGLPIKYEYFIGAEAELIFVSAAWSAIS